MARSAGGLLSRFATLRPPRSAPPRAGLSVFEALRRLRSLRLSKCLPLARHQLRPPKPLGARIRAHAARASWPPPASLRLAAVTAHDLSVNVEPVRAAGCMTNHT